MSTFGDIQRSYAAHGVAVYPVSPDKHPAITNYQRVGLPGSAQLVLKFPDVNAAGFIAGPRNRVALLDIDSADPRLAAEMRARFGVTPLEVVTPSGGRHLYYRHRGEARHIRALEFVDILGKGHVICAGSITAKGRYEIERGSLDDLARLPQMRSDAMPKPDKPGRALIPMGERGNALFAFCSKTAWHCDTFDQLLDAARTWADDRLAAPLRDTEIIGRCKSAWKYRDGRRSFMGQIITAEQQEALRSNRDGMALFANLVLKNGSRAEFWIADGWSVELGWPLRAFRKARAAVLAIDLIEQIRPPRKGHPAVYRWKLRPPEVG